MTDTQVSANVTADAQKQLLQVWEKCIDLQTHFNEMCMNIRRTAIGTLAALLAAGAIAFRFGGTVVVFNWTVSIASLFSTVAICCWLAFYLLDRFWYHALLRAAVRYTESLEIKAIELNLVVSLSMTREIREANHISLWMTGARKIDIFYLGIFALLIAVTTMMFSGSLRPVLTP